MKTSFKASLLAILCGLSVQTLAADVSITCSAAENTVEFSYTPDEGLACSVTQTLTLDGQELVETFDVTEAQTSLVNTGAASIATANATLTCRSDTQQTQSSAASACGGVLGGAEEPAFPEMPEFPGFEMPERTSMPAVSNTETTEVTRECTVINGVAEGDCDDIPTDFPGFEIPEASEGSSVCTVENGVQTGDCDGVNIQVSTCSIENGVQEGDCESFNLCEHLPELEECN